MTTKFNAINIMLMGTGVVMLLILVQMNHGVTLGGGWRSVGIIEPETVAAPATISHARSNQHAVASSTIVDVQRVVLARARND